MCLPGRAACLEVRKAVKIVGHTVPSVQLRSLWTRSGTGTGGRKSAPSGGSLAQHVLTVKEQPPRAPIAAPNPVSIHLARRPRAPTVR